MMSHDEIRDLLAIAALDAVDVDTLAEIEEHAATCPRCQSELDSYRAVASALGNSVEELPDGLWTNISSQLWERPNDQALVPTLVIGGNKADIVPIGSSSRSSRRIRAALGAVAIAAAASIVVLTLSLVSTQHHVTNLQSAVRVASRSAVQRAMTTPGHQVVNLTSSTDQRIAQFVMLPDGRGYLVKSNMPTLPSDETYQLWGIVAGSPVSIGVMGRSPSDATFTLNSSPGPTELAVTVQKSGGSLIPAKHFVGSGQVETL
jgi:uncharacterized protein (UPF0212 family)